MIYLLIVEDEQVIRNGIEKHVPWEELGVGKVRTAENARVGLEICEAYHPDIIISDIKMPGMNGVELCSRFRAALPDCQIIFISGYSDKEYLKAAISLGVVSYVEKPIVLQELTAAVRQAVEAVQKAKRQHDNVLHALLYAPEDTRRQQYLYGKGKELEQDAVYCIMIVKNKRKGGNQTLIAQASREYFMQLWKKEKLHFMIDYPDEYSLVMLVSGKQEWQIPDQTVGKGLCEALQAACGGKEECFLAIGEPVDSLSQLWVSYQTAQQALRALAFKGWNQYALAAEEIREYQGSISTQEQNRFYKCLKNRQAQEALDILDKWYEIFRNERAAMSFQVRNIYFMLENIAVRAENTIHLEPKEEASYNNSNNSFLETAKTIEELHQYVRHHIQSILEESEEEQRSNFLVKNVITYMNENLHNKDISIKLLAEEVYLTPTYLSALFKKTTGVTIGQYLTDIRVGRAKELLADPQFKLYQIAELVGYEDANYFAKIFKKKTGMLPSEYRENRMS